MRINPTKNKKYRIPSGLNNFQKEMYIHLIEWKWEKITKEVGEYKYKDKVYYYDTILPKSVHNSYPLIYSAILYDLLKHKEKYYFKMHQHFNHMASSQAANINLFLPILLNPNANIVLRALKPDFDSLELSKLFKGFRIEYWDGNSSEDKGLLGDHSSRSGTDSDIGIAYLNKEKELCLWLIEHKLTEKEFTECGGFNSKSRNNKKHICSKSFNDILEDKNLCYYHDIRHFNYWNLTDTQKSFFINHNNCSSCPFKGGVNQLWRNQLLGLALENTGLYKHVYFSIVKHSRNTSLDKSIGEYRNLINNNSKFSVFDSKDVVDAALSIGDIDLNKWADWYKKLYKI